MPPFPALFESVEHEQKVFEELLEQYPCRPHNPGNYSPDSMIKRHKEILSLFEDCFDPWGARCLDLGCGRGCMAYMLYKGGASLSIGTDVELTRIHPGFREEENERFFYGYCDSQDMHFLDHYFDCVTMLSALQFVPSPKKAFSEIARVLKVGGRVLTQVGPMYYSPFGAHIYGNIGIPYAHLIFSSAVMTKYLGEPARHLSALYPITERDFFDLAKLYQFEVVDYKEHVNSEHQDILQRFPQLLERYQEKDLLLSNISCVLEYTGGTTVQSLDPNPNQQTSFKKRVTTVPCRVASIGFYGNHTNYHKQVAPLLRDLKIKSTFFIQPEKLREADNMSYEQVVELYQQGHEIAQIPGFDLNIDLIDWGLWVPLVIESKRLLLEIGVKEQVTFGYPKDSGWSQERLRSFISSQFKIGVIPQGGFNSVACEPALIKSTPFTTASAKQKKMHPVEALVPRLNKRADKHDWFNCFTYDLSETANENGCSSADLIALVEELKSRDYLICPVKEAFSEWTKVSMDL